MTMPEGIEQYALRMDKKLKLGGKKIGEGALRLIAKVHRTVRNQMGYGVVGPLDEATAKRIVSDWIAPGLDGAPQG